MVADDIDRLEAQELAELLMAVRMGRFTGVRYLAYAQAAVIDMMSTAAVVGLDPQRALAYLEIIVQFTLTIL